MKDEHTPVLLAMLLLMILMIAVSILNLNERTEERECVEAAVASKSDPLLCYKKLGWK